MSTTKREFLQQQAALALTAEVKAEKPPSPCAWCEPGSSGSHTICQRHMDEQLASVTRHRLAAGRGDGKHHCSRCDYYAAMDRPCPHSPLGREIAIDYGYAK